jgi:N-acetyl-beta-hexosaminidase
MLNSTKTQEFLDFQLNMRKMEISVPNLKIRSLLKRIKQADYHVTKIMPMDSQHSGKDDFNNSSNRGSLAARQIHSKGLVKDTAHVESEL